MRIHWVIMTVILIILWSEYVGAQEPEIYFDDEVYFITGDYVNVRKAPSLTSEVSHQAHWGMMFKGKRINEEWYGFYNGYFSEWFYVFAQYVAPSSQFYQRAGQKAQKNPQTKYELLKYYAQNGNIQEAEGLSLDLIRNHIFEEVQYITFTEHCALFGVQAYLEIIKRDANFADPYIVDYTNKVLTIQQKSPVLAIALIDQAKYYLLHGHLKESEKRLFTVITEYSHHLFIPLSCAYDTESVTFPLVYVKDLFLALYLVEGWTQNSGMIKKLDELRHSDDVLIKIIADDLREKVGWGLWDHTLYGNTVCPELGENVRCPMFHQRERE